MSARRNIEKIYWDVAKNYGASQTVVFRRIVFFGALPMIFAGLRIALAVSFIVLVAAEFVATKAGIGYMIWNSWELLQVDVMFCRHRHGRRAGPDRDRHPPGDRAQGHSLEGGIKERKWPGQARRASSPLLLYQDCRASPLAVRTCSIAGVSPPIVVSRDKVTNSASLLLRLPVLLPGRRVFRVDQHEADPARLARLVDPGVVGALLHHDVAGLQVHLLVVEQHVDLAVEHDGVVDRAGCGG